MLLLFTITTLLLVLALAALASLHGVLSRLDQTTRDSRLIEELHELHEQVSEVEVALYSRTVDPDALAAQVRTLADQVQIVADDPDLHDRVLLLERHIQGAAADGNPEEAAAHRAMALRIAAGVRAKVLQVIHFAQDRLKDDQDKVTRAFRWMVVGIALGFLVVLNASMLLMMRAASMVLRPVERLIEAHRELGAEHFEHRVEVDRRDEFGELTEAFNRLASQLQENEQRKMQFLGQVALTLNHELNNAVSIIDLQLSLLRRQKGSAEFEGRLTEIQKGLQRMTRVVQGLMHVRRIVLTDYVAGVKMLDLERSMQEDTPTSAGPNPSENHATQAG